MPDLGKKATTSAGLQFAYPTPVNEETPSNENQKATEKTTVPLEDLMSKLKNM
jgi:hypothetical protein